MNSERTFRLFWGNFREIALTAGHLMTISPMLLAASQAFHSLVPKA